MKRNGIIFRIRIGYLMEAELSRTPSELSVKAQDPKGGLTYVIRHVCYLVFGMARLLCDA